MSILYIQGLHFPCGLSLKPAAWLVHLWLSASTWHIFPLTHVRETQTQKTRLILHNLRRQIGLNRQNLVPYTGNTAGLHDVAHICPAFTNAMHMLCLCSAKCDECYGWTGQIVLMWVTWWCQSWSSKLPVLGKAWHTYSLVPSHWKWGEESLACTCAYSSALMRYIIHVLHMYNRALVNWQLRYATRYA